MATATVKLKPNEVHIRINDIWLANLLKQNLCCHVNKPLTQELIDVITTQIVESVYYFINKAREEE